MGAAGRDLAAHDAGDAGDDEEAAGDGVEADGLVEDEPAEEDGDDGDDVGDEGGAEQRIAYGVADKRISGAQD